MSRSKIVDIDAGSLTHEILIDSGVFASAAGGNAVLTSSDTANIVSPNSCVKYVNITCETGLRDTAPAAPGFIEYAIILRTELTGAYAIPAGFTAAFSTQTVGDIARNYYRGDCIWYGSFPVSRELPVSVPINIKLPDKACKYKNGTELIMIMGHHGLNIADTTSRARTFFQVGFKAYL